MKHQVPESMKFKRLCRRLGVTPALAAGTLELLWIATQKEAPRGDIGKFSNEDIAIAVWWDGDPDELVQTLVETGWLDTHPVHRLLVHDWHDHAPRYVHGIVSKIGGFFTTDADNSAELQSATTVPDVRKEQRNLTKPNLTKEDASASLSAEPPEPPQPDEAAEFMKVWNAADGVCQCRELKAKRRSALKARLSEHVETEDGRLPWLEALQRAIAAKFPLRCTRGDPGGWRPDADFILRPDSLTKIFEGKYDWERGNQRGSPSGPTPNRRGEIPATEADLAQAFARHDH